MALDPRVPASFHGLPQKYHTPSRLWQIGFHQLLERMRHAVTSTPSSSNAYESHTNVLEHLIEFIQYAYTHYSQLFEDPKVALFRSAWIEQLGDLARYRMAVAGMASRVSAASNGQSSRSRLEFEIPKENIPRPIEEASIGDAALGDWEIEEQDTWREMAKDWYGQGIAETPGAGRLQHHLALLSKGDELKGLYHYAKRSVHCLILLEILTDSSVVIVSLRRILISALKNLYYLYSKTIYKLEELNLMSLNLNYSFIFMECCSPRFRSTTLMNVWIDSSSD